MAKIAIFDLDETLICKDSSSLWANFVVDKGWIQDTNFIEQGEKLYESYLNGTLDIVACTEYCLRALKNKSTKNAQNFIDEYIEKCVMDMIYPEAWKTLQYHRDLGHHLLLISASGTHLVKPIAKKLGFSSSIGCDAEIINDRYSGKMIGVPSYQSGKIKRFISWVKEQNFEVEETWFYSDSMNDLPLLKYVDHPIATNPSPVLEELASKKKWPIYRWEMK